MHRDKLRSPTIALPAAGRGGAGRIVDRKGTGWNTLAAKGIWRPQGVGGAHIVDFGLQRDAYQLRSTRERHRRLDGRQRRARNLAFVGDAMLQRLYAQDTWTFAPRWKTVLGARLEYWKACERPDLERDDHRPASGAHRDRPVAQGGAGLPGERAHGAEGLDRPRRAHPTVGELYQGGTTPRHLVHQRPQPEAGDSWTTELTAERDLGNGLLRLTLFYETHERRAVLAAN